ncbi:MAG: PEP/pyruvate-binding domain-containing protein [Anaerolineales bacterium]
MMEAVMTDLFVLDLQDPRATLAAAGGKGASLARLAAAGLPVPGGFHVTTAAYDRFIQANGLQPHILAALAEVHTDQPASLEQAAGRIQTAILNAPLPNELADAVAAAYEALPGEFPAVAVRSSATAEDLPDLSFAGQQESYLNVQGVGEVLDAVQRCWASLWTPRAIGYRARAGIGPEGLSLAVVVQEMVPAEASGVMFTANPLTGQRDELVINAAWGLGEAIVGGEVTPDTIVVDKSSLQVLQRETAEKQHMTVEQTNGTAVAAVPADLQRQAVLDDEAAARLAALGRQIEDLYEMPMDIEWTRSRGRFAIVQARPVTALPEPSAPPPTEWPLPPKTKLMRASVVDVMPDPLSPLFATLGLGSYNQQMVYLAETYFKAGDVLPDDLITTVNEYAYYRISFTLRQWVALLVKMGIHMPAVLKQGEHIWKETTLPQYRETVQHWSARQVTEYTPAELLEGVDAILEAAMRYLTSLQIGPMPLPAQSEMVFTSVYDRFIRQEADPPASTFMLGFDSAPIEAEKQLFDLALWCRQQPGLAEALLATPTEMLVKDILQGADLDGMPPAWAAGRERFQTYLAVYGHTIYDLDFANPVPADHPAPLLDTLKLYLRGQGRDPKARQETLQDNRMAAEQAVRARIGGLRRWLFEKTLGRAQRLAPMREDCIFYIGLGYPRLRKLLGELGRRFVLAGMLAEAQDIYWLEETEVRTAAERMGSGQALEDFSAQVERRKWIWRGAQRATPPPQLPADAKLMGVDWSSFLPTGAEHATENQIRGLGASPGKVTAPACVLRGPEDFGKMQAGDVLVAGITTPAWTPLFARAAAVVTEVGGPLSHGSIVAREYGIPAVLGTGVATRWVRDGELITVDGDAGTVTRLDLD